MSENTSPFKKEGKSTKPVGLVVKSLFLPLSGISYAGPTIACDQSLPVTLQWLAAKSLGSRACVPVPAPQHHHHWHCNRWQVTCSL